MPWYLDQIGGQPRPHATYKFGEGQELPESIGSHTVVPDQSLWPIVIEQINNVQKNLDFQIGPFTGVILVSAKFKALVESFEPNMHHFIPVEMRSNDGKINLDDFYILKPGQFTEKAIIVADSEMMEVFFKGTMRRIGPTTQEPRIMWKEEAIRGKHLWTERFFEEGIIVSGALYAAAKELGLRGWLAIEGRAK